MTILIFDLIASGHHYEYLTHLLAHCRRHPRHTFHFVMNSAIRQLPVEIPTAEEGNIFLHFEKTPPFRYKTLKARFQTSRIFFDILKRYNKEINPDKIFLISIENHLPYIFLAKGMRHKIHGIQYEIPIRKAGRSWKKRISDYIKFRGYSLSSNISCVHLLNDPESACEYNRRYHTSIFAGLPEPLEITENIIKTNTDKGSTTPDKLRLLLCGELNQRKGTLTFLNALAMLEETDIKRIEVKIAGRMDPDIEPDFNNLLQQLNLKCDIKYIQGFVPFEQLHKLIATADYTVLPYSNNAQSSGILGRCAMMNTAVIGPAEGLLGHLISQYGLGMTIKKINATTLAEELHKCLDSPLPEIDGSKYLQNNNAHAFCVEIMDKLMKED